MTLRKGHCLCGAVSFEYEGPENWVGHCHCESCRRNTSSAFTTFMGVPNTAYRFTGIEPAVYQSSPGVRRLFCPKCGAPVAYDADKFADEIHFYLASLEDALGVEPKFHVFVGEVVPWVKVGDDLPKYVTGTSGPKQGEAAG
ncbi:MAG TPA: GFA family protein [Thermohalobaculum sp.]|nr:GFA family protein [Thermohalobaculum sp.]